MKNQIWPAIHDIFRELDKLIGQSQGVVSVKDKGERRGMQVLKRGIQTDDVVPLRAEIRNKLNFLRAKLGEQLTERETYLVLFPIVIYFDEIVQSKVFQAQHITWPPLQKELFQIDNGGETYYEMLDDILRKPETIPFVYEVFYFCLSDGFRGKYAENPLKIEEYQTKLRGKITLPKVENQQTDAEIPNLMRSEKFPFWSYVGTVVLLAAVFGALYLLATVS